MPECQGAKKNFLLIDCPAIISPECNTWTERAKSLIQVELLLGKKEWEQWPRREKE